LLFFKNKLKIHLFDLYLDNPYNDNMRENWSKKDKIILIFTIILGVLTLVAAIANFLIIVKSNFKHSIFHIAYFIFVLTLFTSLLIYLLVHSRMQDRIILLKKQKEKDDMFLDQVMKTFVNFIDSKDEYTRGHSSRVANYSKALAKQLGMDQKKQQELYYMGLMHDIGKINVPDDILNKTSHLSTDEWDVIKMHTENGAMLLKDFTIMPSLRDAVLYHHERYDGKGYVYQLKGEEIPLGARIVCVADSFDAMNSNRCYRLKYSKDRIIQELDRCSGKQFDPDVAKAMIELIKNGTIDALNQQTNS